MTPALRFSAVLLWGAGLLTVSIKAETPSQPEPVSQRLPAASPRVIDSELSEKVVHVDHLRSWKYVVLHHTATETGSLESIDAAHKQRKDSEGNPWRGIGYHFLIGNGRGMSDGEVVATFRWTEQCDGAHAGHSVYNNQGIGICLVGNFEEAPPTPAQLNSLRQLIATLQETCQINAAGIVRHTDIKPTACPGKNFPWEELLGDAIPTISPSVARSSTTNLQVHLPHRSIPTDGHHQPGKLHAEFDSNQVLKPVLTSRRQAIHSTGE